MGEAGTCRSYIISGVAGDAGAGSSYTISGFGNAIPRISTSSPILEPQAAVDSTTDPGIACWRYIIAGSGSFFCRRRDAVPDIENSSGFRRYASTVYRTSAPTLSVVVNTRSSERHIYIYILVNCSAVPVIHTPCSGVETPSSVISEPPPRF